MTLPLFTRKDVGFCHAVASLCRHLPPEKRTAHLLDQAEDLARRIGEALPAEEPVALEAANG